MSTNLHTNIEQRSLETNRSRIKAPIIYILGGASNIVPVETQMDIRQALPQAEIVMLPGLGHYPSDEKPVEFLAVVDRFLAASGARK